MTVVDARQQVARLQILLSRLQSRGFHVAPRPGSVAHVLRSLRSDAVPESGPQVQAGFTDVEGPVGADSLREIAALVASDALEAALVTGAGISASDDAYEPASAEIEVVDSEVDLALFHSEPAPESDERPKPLSDRPQTPPVSQPDSAFSTSSPGVSTAPSDGWESDGGEAPDVGIADSLESIPAESLESIAADDEITPARGNQLQAAPRSAPWQETPAEPVAAPALQEGVSTAEPTAVAEITVGVETVHRSRLGLGVQVAAMVRTTRSLQDESFADLLLASLELEP